MGCDIHAYIEYRKYENEHWWALSDEIDLDRNYRLFGLMAEGVRCSFPESIPVRGLPDGVSWRVKDANELYIVADGDSGGSGERWCELGDALLWEKHGSEIRYNENEEPKWVSDPDNHSHSWLTLPEFLHLYNIYREMPDSGTEPACEAILSAMQKLAEHYKGVRIVFWFDN